MARQTAGRHPGKVWTMTAVPDIQLSDGNRIPQVGLGVLRIDDDQTAGVVRSALELG